MSTSIQPSLTEAPGAYARPARALVVDDEPTIRRYHGRLLQDAGYDVELAGDGVEAIAKLPLGFDVVLLDADIPLIDGYEVARQIRSDREHGHVPIVVITGFVDPAGHRRAIQAGVNDFLFKPVDPEILRLRCQWLVEFKRLRDQLKVQNADLRSEVRRQTESLRAALAETSIARRQSHAAHLDTVRRLTMAAEYKDRTTGGHIERMGKHAEALARIVGLSEVEVDRLRRAAPLHDVGKLAIPDAILLKPGRLDLPEMDVMQTHTTLGAEILSGSPSTLLQLGETIALTHHERWDGSGYPNGLSREHIPVEGRICAIVDFFDALSMDRPYRAAVRHEDVFAMMEERAGTHFDPYLLERFMRHREDFSRIQLGRQPARDA